MSTYINVKRKYGTSLIFRKGGVIDTADDNKNSWKVISNEDGISFNKQDSIFKKDLRNKNTVLYISKPDSYLYNDREISIDGDSYSLGFWISIDQPTVDLFYNNSSLIVPIVEWEDDYKLNCSIILGRIPGTNDPCIKLTIGSVERYIRFYAGFESDTWYHILYNRKVDTDKIFIDGKRVIEYKVDTKKANNTSFNNIKIGNWYPANKIPSVSYMLDDFFVCNSTIYDEDFDLPRAYINNIFPEVEYLEELETSEEDNKIGTSSGMYYKYHTLTKVSSGVYQYMSLNSGLLFLNSVYMAPPRWESWVDNSDPKNSKTFIRLTNQEDIKAIDQFGGKLVFVEICQTKFGNIDAGSTYTIYTEQVSATTENQTKFKIPRPSFAKDDMNSFILFDGSLAAIQIHRYKYIKEGNDRYIEFTNKYDHPCSNNMPLTFVFVNRNEYKGDSNDQQLNPQIYFSRFHCVVTTAGRCNIPKFVGKDYGKVGFGIESSLFFINGTWMHPDSFIIKKNVLTMSNEKDDSLLAKGSDITILVLSSTKSYNSQNLLAKEFIIRGVSDFEDMTSLGITRPVYWKKKDGADYAMYHKLHFYDDNVVPKCNFPTIDKLGIQFKE